MRGIFRRLGELLLLLGMMLAPQTSLRAEGGGVRVYLPLVGAEGSGEGVRSRVGVDVSEAQDERARAALAGAGWVRWAPQAVAWGVVEAVEGQYDWSGLAGVQVQLERYRQAGLEVILVIQGVPEWAALEAGVTCGPVRPDRLAAMGRYWGELVRRLGRAAAEASGGPVAGVRYWEVGNEPDIPAELVAPDSPFGCWGDGRDPLGGGGRYAAMLAAVTPQIKAADPQAQVLVGGLLLDCDPRQPPQGKDCRSGRFLDGILEAGGAEYLDGVAFHAYDYYFGRTGVYANPNWHTGWDTGGPSVGAKAAYVRERLAAYGAGEKRLMATEVALLCAPCSQDAAFERTKALYLTQAYAVGLNAGLEAQVWYNLYGWRNSGLLMREGGARAAYDSFRAVIAWIGSGQERGSVTAGAGLTGWAFEQGGRRVWVVWSQDGEAHALGAHVQPARLLDGRGQERARNAQIGREPVYLIFGEE